jgi:hypothetical protein
MQLVVMVILLFVLQVSGLVVSLLFFDDLFFRLYIYQRSLNTPLKTCFLIGEFARANREKRNLIGW